MPHTRGQANAVWRSPVGGRESGFIVSDQFEVSLQDEELLDEVELTTNLIIAASESDHDLSQAEIDEILGLLPGDGFIPPEQAGPEDVRMPPVMRSPRR